MAVRSTNTYAEGLQSLNQDVAAMMLLPDANPEFLMQLQAQLIQEASAPLQAAAGQAQAVPAPPGNAGPIGGAAPPPEMLAQLMGGGGGAAPPAMAPPGSAPLPATPAADELRRMLAG